MNEILKRRSIRKYTDEKIPVDIINEILKAGMNAPTAMNSRPWEFIIVDDLELLRKLSTVTPYAFMLAKAANAAVVIGKETTKYWQQDLAASTQNILLEATTHNVGTCWIGVAPDNEAEGYVKDLLSVPDDYRIFSIISMGYSDKEKEPNDSFDNNLIHVNKF